MTAPADPVVLEKPVAPACERNKDPILGVLRTQFATSHSVLEIGAGTGQHAAYFAAHLPHITWQPSDVAAHLDGIRAWVQDASDNMNPPFELDVRQREQWPKQRYDGVFTANTAHIMGVETVADMFACVGRVLRPAGKFCQYGPFKYQCAHTAPSNAEFDDRLKQRDPAMGLRDVAWLQLLASEQKLTLREDIDMPANNRLLVWQMSDA